jgi:predicted O-linked N-acetylglucosamine transferase (SPINDLY family)
MTWLGYPDTTGLEAIDYRITDAIADRPPLADTRHSERLLRVGPPFLCYRPPDDSPPVAPRNIEGPVVFGSCNVLHKVNPPLIALWARILKEVPGSRLLLKSRLLQNGDVVDRVLQHFDAEGVGPERLVLRGWTAHRVDHLSTYNEIDIALDTYPYNGTTTTCEALWMGVPVVTLAGDVHMSRVGASLLTAAGLHDLVATDEEEYIGLAIALAGDTARRQALRITMRGRLATSALLDHAAFVDRLEAGFREAWCAWCEDRRASDNTREDLSDRLSREEWLCRGQLLQAKGKLADALECYRACAAAYPSDLRAREAIADTLSASWRLEECIAACREGLDAAPQNATIFSCYLLYSHYAAHPDARAVFDLHRRYGDLMSVAAPPLFATHPNSRDPERALRIGYVSRDFCEHSVASFIEPVIAHHDRSRYEVYCYYTRAHSDRMTARVAELSDVWREAHQDDADALAARIREDGIDILVDLGGHTFSGALAVFARRPAPVQMTWLGYPDTTGLISMDYRVTDAIADPEPLSDALHTERLIRLAPPFLCFRPPADSPLVVARRGDRPVVFGSFNVIMKVNEPLLDMWAQILQAVPGSRMLIKSRLLEHDETVHRLLHRFEARGIESNRLELRSWMPDRAKHLAAYNEIDIALDTFPYNGTTTTCEALWMGTPVVTLAGTVHMSRVGATLLTSAWLPELVTKSAQEYVEVAVALARDTARREMLSAGMRQRLSASPLADYAGFTRKLESGMRQAWTEWCRTERVPDLSSSRR